ncbi:Sodium/potassium-transporting ATPase subunit beta-2 [Portunus trituberculatus]|uniref:Sodium/potassium-transporting ATPase subunit beta-2 n=1 Tax=Portunus trituberculatus TaxID=210409 RepID=A0A5B7F040_PORTR|nr:Sodium/potassium-transporting ATPase subunit beta-2 [Portunus trituberculatus]
MIKWVPEVYETLEELPENMPQSLKDHIKSSMELNGGKIPKMIWVSCEGENPADQEYIGPIRYSPWNANVLINIECRAWAKNIVHDRQNRLGLVHFELLKD